MAFALMLILAAVVAVPSLAGRIGDPRRSLRIALAGAAVLLVAAWGVVVWAGR